MKPTIVQRSRRVRALLTSGGLKRLIRLETILFAVAVLLLGAAAVAQPAGPTNVTFGLVAWWPLDETSGTTIGDASGYGNTATLFGSPTSLTGLVTNAYHFNGSSQYATVPYSASYDLSSLTLMCWINTTAYGGMVVSHYGYSSWELSINQGRTDNTGAAGEPSFNNSSTWTSATNTINNGAWNHIAVVVSGGTTTFYINGAPNASFSQKAPPTTASYGLGLAERVGGGVDLAGSLDDVRIYNRPLSAAEIADQYQWRSGSGPLFAVSNAAPATNAPPSPSAPAPSTASTYYIDYSTGSDGNNGLSTSTPWQHHPFMAAWTGQYTHHAGDQFIFKGGVTWPSGCFPVVTSYGGTVGQPDYYGVSFSYYAGAAWSKPIWDDNGNPLNTMASSGQALVHLSGSYVTLDSIVITNLNWNANVTVFGINMGGGSGIVITNCEFRNFVCTSPGADTLECVKGYTGIVNPGSKVSHCIFTGQPTSSGVGYAAYYVETFEYNDVSFMPNGLVGQCNTNQYNVVHNMQPSITAGVHENCLYQMIKQDGVSYCHHNILTNNSCGTLLYFDLEAIASGHSGTLYCFDNLVANNTCSVPDILLDPYPEGSGTRGTAYCWNNTLQDAESTSWGYIRVAHRSSSDWNVVVGENNHFITEGSAGVVPDAGSLAIISTDCSLTNNNATANAAGYSYANLWQPTSASSPTVGHGTNGPSTVFTIDILNNARNPTIWDIGAYQFSSQAMPPSLSPPTNLRVLLDN